MGLFSVAVVVHSSHRTTVFAAVNKRDVIHALGNNIKRLIVCVCVFLATVKLFLLLLCVVF